MFVNYDNRVPVNLDQVNSILREVGVNGRPAIKFAIASDDWVRWEFDTVEERDYVFDHLPVTNIVMPLTPKEPI